MEYYTETRQDSTNSYDRYKNCKLLKDNDTQEVLLETRDINTIPIIPGEDLYHTVKVNEEYRLDLLADKYYGNPLLWWVIAQANEIYDPLSKPTLGDTLRIPSLLALYGNKGILL